MYRHISAGAKIENSESEQILNLTSKPSADTVSDLIFVIYRRNKPLAVIYGHFEIFGNDTCYVTFFLFYL